MSARRGKKLALLFAGAVAVLTACGTGSGGGGGTTSSAVISADEAAVKAGSADVTSLGSIDLPSDSPTVARDKRIVAITCTNQGEGCVASANAVAEATKQFGWKVDVIDGKGDPGVWNSAILSAISSKADAIVLSAVAPALVKDALGQAAAAHIPVVSIMEPIDHTDGVYGHVTPDHSAQGKLAADWVVADSGGSAKVIVVTDNEYVELNQRVDAFEAELAKCAGCKVVAQVNTTLATVATRLPGAVAAALQQHPDATYVVTPSDLHGLMSSQGIQQAGRTGQVKLTSFDGNSPNYDLLRQGVQAMDVVESYPLQGWLAADLLIRAFAGEPGRDYVVPSRLLTKDNVPSGPWEPGVDFRALLDQLWANGGQG